MKYIARVTKIEEQGLERWHHVTFELFRTPEEEATQLVRGTVTVALEPKNGEGYELGQSIWLHWDEIPGEVQP